MTTGGIGRRAVIAIVVALGLVAAACGGGSGDDRGARLRVFAAASLTDAFRELAAAFELANPAFEVELNLAGSAALVTQIEAGAPFDVFASANEVIADRLAAAGLTGAGSTFATNELAIVVPAGNPGAITDLSDFEDDDLFLGLCSAGVPCGDLAEEALQAAAITASIDTREPNVRALLTKVETGELDGGLVYRTDVLAAGDAVLGLDLPAGLPATTTYPITLATEPADRDGGEAFVRFVLGDEGRRILAEHGFGAP